MYNGHSKNCKSTRREDFWPCWITAVTNIWHSSAFLSRQARRGINSFLVSNLEALGRGIHGARFHKFREAAISQHGWIKGKETKQVVIFISSSEQALGGHSEGWSLSGFDHINAKAKQHLARSMHNKYSSFPWKQMSLDMGFWFLRFWKVRFDAWREGLWLRTVVIL